MGSALTRARACSILALAALVSCGRSVATTNTPSPAHASTYSGFAANPLDSAELHRFLSDMPKGGDLHNHLSGSVYAETYVKWAAEDGVCIVRATESSVRGPCTGMTDRIPATQVLNDSSLYRAVIDAWSMRNWHPGGESGADHFFATFGKYSAASPDERLGDMLAEVASRAAAQHISYMELMMNPGWATYSRLATRLGWNPDFERMRTRFDSAGLEDSLKAASRMLDRVEARERELLHCGTPRADAGCGVVVRYLYQVIRSRAPEQVFGQILTGYEWPGIDSRIVGFNLVAPEHGDVAVRDFSLHMSMIDRLHADFPRVRVTLHAGELAKGMVPDDALRSHIRQSVEVGHALRIGHGVDVLGEDSSAALLREMANRRVLVEIALTSNNLILGVSGAQHPLAAYLRAGVPVALATDDPGVSRSDMTREFVRGVEDQHLDYQTLKQMVRNSIEYSFAEGQSLWRSQGDFTPVAECAAPQGGLNGASCRAYTTRNLKARLESELENAFAEFERTHRG